MCESEIEAERENKRGREKRRGIEFSISISFFFSQYVFSPSINPFIRWSPTLLSKTSAFTVSLLLNKLIVVSHVRTSLHLSSPLEGQQGALVPDMIQGPQKHPMLHHLYSEKKNEDKVFKKMKIMKCFVDPQVARRDAVRYVHVIPRLIY